jgi:hypothetical protein
MFREKVAVMSDTSMGPIIMHVAAVALPRCVLCVPCTSSFTHRARGIKGGREGEREGERKRQREREGVGEEVSE